ncbi:MAG: hypothetical protein E3J72_04165 [Planctomycetota bacterium]|nr:MAG: hypothetical protein E3J72_04165 [Planctomycetota bacterium]
MDFIQAILITLILVYVALWLVHAGRTTFVMLRVERTEREKKIYTKTSVIHTYFHASLLVLSVITFIILRYVILRELPFEVSLTAQLTLFASLGITVTAFMGIFIQKSTAGKVLSSVFFPLAVLVMLIFR